MLLSIDPDMWFQVVPKDTLKQIAKVSLLQPHVLTHISNGCFKQIGLEILINAQFEPNPSLMIS